MENSIRSIMEYLCGTLAFEKITYSKCLDSHILRASVTPFARRGEAYIQIETFTDDGKALHRNLAAGEAAEVLCELAERQYRQTNIHTADGDCEIRFSKKEQCSILNRIRPAADAPAAPAARLKSHNKKKQYLLDPAADDGARAPFSTVSASRMRADGFWTKSARNSARSTAFWSWSTISTVPFPPTAQSSSTISAAARAI